MITHRPAIDYARPLFNRYDISVEFERHLMRVRQSLHQGWRYLSSRSDANIVDKFTSEKTICRLELFEGDGTLTQIYDDLWEFASPYRGDEVLWHIYPVSARSDIKGELVRGELLLRVLANSSEEALDILVVQIRAILDVIAQQAARIDVFEQSQPLLVQAELAKLRNSTPERRGASVH